VQVKYERPLPEPGLAHRLAGDRQSHVAAQHAKHRRLEHPTVPGTCQRVRARRGRVAQIRAGLFGMDVVYQPIWSTTWAEASTPTATSGGGLIPVGGRTTRTPSTSRTRCFAWASVAKSRGRSQGPSNAAARLLVRFRPLQPGAARLRRGRYTPAETIVGGMDADLGLSVRHPEFELCYRGRVSHGTDRLVVTPSNGNFLANARPIRRLLLSVLDSADPQWGSRGDAPILPSRAPTALSRVTGGARMMTRIVRTAYFGLLVLATGCDGWTTPSGPPASLDAELAAELEPMGYGADRADSRAATRARGPGPGASVRQGC